jgi:tripartite-type tricarboxylate transporter receptor subunit TctC
MMKDGRIRILASTAPKRTANLQNIPTMIESGFPDFDFQGFVGLAAPAKTSPDIINLLNKHVNEIVRGESFRTRFAPFGMQPIANNTPADFDAYLRREIERNHARAKLSKPQ